MMKKKEDESFIDSIKNDPEKAKKLAIYVVFLAVFGFVLFSNDDEVQIDQTNQKRSSKQEKVESQNLPIEVQKQQQKNNSKGISSRKFKNLSDERDTLKNELNEMRKAISRFEEEKIRMIGELEEYKIQINKSDTRHDKLQENIIKLEEMKQAMKNEKEKMDKDLEKMKIFKKKLEAKRKEIESLEIGLGRVSIRTQKAYLTGANIKYMSPPNYERLGKGLVYNCLGGHWACVDEESYKSCRVNMRWAIQNDKKIECYVSNVYATSSDCGTVQVHNINTQKQTKFCTD